ncbi:hypothetical protein PUMCH_001310 [Australozyma saopauloensis]|uniref:Uncharacterized protein n=1 Tax=Australozyma saopauloensis TaxID=291208 RepID=A0AAX4H742_9ASCO|nr:hypothetical protein PUMCH_001310 [[Candida] saopauloensis]
MTVMTLIPQLFGGLGLNRNATSLDVGGLQQTYVIPEASRKLPPLSFILGFSKNTIYEDLERGVRSVYRIEADKVVWGKKFSKENLDLLTGLMLRALTQILETVSNHEFLETNNVKKMLQFRDGYSKENSVQPKYWILDVMLLESYIHAYEQMHIREWDSQAPLELDKSFREYIGKVAKSIYKNLHKLKICYETTYQGVWLVFQIRYEYGFPGVRRWKNCLLLGLVGSVVGGLGSWNIEKSYEFIQSHFYICMIAFFIFLALLGLFLLMACSTGRILYFVRTMNKPLMDCQRETNLKIIDAAKENWPLNIFGAYPTWRFWKFYQGCRLPSFKIDPDAQREPSKSVNLRADSLCAEDSWPSVKTSKPRCR